MSASVSPCVWIRGPMMTCFFAKSKPISKTGTLAWWAMLKKPVFQGNIGERVPSGDNANIMLSCCLNLSTICETTPCEEDRLTGIPPIDSNSCFTPGTNIVCLPKKRIRIRKENKTATPKKKSQFDVCGAMAMTSFCSLGSSPLICQPVTLSNVSPSQPEKRFPPAGSLFLLGWIKSLISR